MPADPRRRWKLAILSGAVLAAVGIAAATRLDSRRIDRVIENVENLPERVAARLGPPGEGQLVTLSDDERRALESLATRLRAKILWSTNRDGNHELYVLDLGSLAAARLTDHPHADIMGRFSPDGERIVFLRSRPEWVSIRESMRWDVWLMNADGSAQRRVAERGFFPHWASDGGSVIFTRDQRVIRLDPESGRESVLLERPATVAEIRRGDLRLSHDGTRAALATEGGEALVYDIGAGTVSPLRGEYLCQPDWAPDDAFVVYIEAVGHGGTRVMRARPNGRRPEVFMDLPGDYSHEYFPKLSNDGAWLVWGAAAEGHEHDRADYEIFVWEVGTAWEEAVRLTHYTGNDMWPDLFVGGDVS